MAVHGVKWSDGGGVRRRLIFLYIIFAYMHHKVTIQKLINNTPRIRVVKVVRNKKTMGSILARRGRILEGCGAIRRRSVEHEHEAPTATTAHIRPIYRNRSIPGSIAVDRWRWFGRNRCSGRETRPGRGTPCFHRGGGAD